MTEQNIEIDEMVSDANISKGKAGGIIAASIIAAASTFLVTFISARALTIEQNAEFLVFWGVMFALFGFVAGTQTESTRAVVSGLQDDHDSSTRASVIGTALAIGAITGGVVLLTSPLWAKYFIPTHTAIAVATIALGAAAYAGEMSMSGCFAGAKEWQSYSWLMAGEAILRLIFVLLAVVISRNLTGFELASALPALTWLVFLLVAPGRRSMKARSDVSAIRLVKFNLQAMLSSAAWAVLVTGFPAMLKATTPMADPAAMATTMLVVQVTRAPIMIPLQAFQGVLITSVAESSEGRVKIIVKLLVGLLALGIVFAIPAALFGPWLMRAVFGSEYVASWWLVGGLMLAAVPMAWLVLTGATAVALSRHRAYMSGWVIAAVAAYLSMEFISSSIEMRAILALVIAPIMGMVVHLWAIAQGKNMATLKTL